ncbi:putative ribonuclease H-like domain-containing protein [Tanacetum coccineum]
MTTLADKSLLSGGDNKPPMLEKHLYDSWKSRMELYMLNRPHGRMILASVEKGPLVWPSITVDGATRLKEYIELTPAEAIQADCDIKAINIILQGLPTEIYALNENASCYDESIKFIYKKGEVPLEYYLRFSLLLNDMKHLHDALEQFHVNTKSRYPYYQQSAKDFVNPSSTSYIYDWQSHCATLFRESTTMLLEQQENTPLVQVGPWLKQRGRQRTVICYNCNGEGHIAKQCTKPKRKRDETWSYDKVLLVQGSSKSSPTMLLSSDDSGCLHDSDLSRYDGFEQSNDVIRSNEQYAEIVRLKQNLFEQVQEKDSLMKTVSDLKNDLKMEENRNVDREIALEKKIKQLDNIIFKRGQSAQTVEVPKELPKFLLVCVVTTVVLSGFCLGSVVTTGSVIVPAGSVIVPTGSVVTTGSVIVPAGSVVTTGSVIVPAGSVVTTGSVIVPAGSVIVPTGSVVTTAEFLY